MTTLRILAKGYYLSEVADVHGISIAFASKVIHPVCDAICSRIDIRFPMLPAEKMEIKNGFYQIVGFPNVLGAINDTLVPIMDNSGDDELNYVCRKQIHALDVEAVCTACLSLMETLRRWLLGYPTKRWLSTLLNTANQKEAICDRANIATRNTIERCLHKTGGSLRFVPCRGVKMIGACFRLHKRAYKDGLPLPEGLENIQLFNNN